MKRVLTIAAIVLLSFLLQTTIFQSLALADVVPNFLLIVTVTFGYMRGEKEGMYTGFFCGLLVDCMFGTIVGLYALLYMLIGYLNGLCHNLYYNDHIVVTVALISLSDLIYNFFYYIFEFLFRNRLDFFYYLVRIIIPEMVYTLLAAVVLYRFLHSLNSWLEYGEKREA